MKNGIMKYHPAFIAQRKMQKELQNKGYNDIFIPNLMVLSPTYAEYKKALYYLYSSTNYYVTKRNPHPSRWGEGTEKVDNTAYI